MPSRTDKEGKGEIKQKQSKGEEIDLDSGETVAWSMECAVFLALLGSFHPPCLSVSLLVQGAHYSPVLETNQPPGHGDTSIAK